MGKSITPEIVVTDNGTAQIVVIDVSATKSETPAIASVKASTNLTLEIQP